MAISLTDLWTAGGVVLGFQITSFGWRISQENAVAQRNELVWLPPADYVNLAAMIVMVLGVFVSAALELSSLPSMTRAFGVSTLLLVGHAASIAGHYELYGRGHARSKRWCTGQEKVCIAVSLLAVAVYICIACWR